MKLLCLFWLSSMSIVSHSEYNPQIIYQQWWTSHLIFISWEAWQHIDCQYVFIVIYQLCLHFVDSVQWTEYRIVSTVLRTSFERLALVVFLVYWPLKALNSSCHIQPFTHTDILSRQRLPCKVPTSSLGAIWGLVSCPRILQHAAGGSRDWTTDLLISEWPAQPPEPQWPYLTDDYVGSLHSLNNKQV